MYRDRYTYGGSEYTSSGPGTGGYTNYNHQAMTNYELSADYVDSTTTYDPRPTQTQVADTVAPDTPSAVTATGVLPSVVTTGKYRDLIALCATPDIFRSITDPLLPRIPNVKNFAFRPEVSSAVGSSKLPWIVQIKRFR